MSTAFNPAPRSPFAPGAPRPAFLLLKGFPDDGRVQVLATGIDRPPMLRMPGSTQVLPLPGEREPGPEIHFGSDRLDINAQLPRVPCINCMADPDVHGKALGQAVMFMEQMRAPCLNHPAAVMRNARDSTSRLLTGIAGLQVPLTVKVNVQRRAELWQAMEQAGIGFPVIAQLAGSAAAMGTVRLDSPQDWEALNPLPWGGRDLYLTQCVDFADAGGHLRKLRWAVVGQEVVSCFGADAGDLQVSPGLHRTLIEVAGRLKLDCFGVVGGLLADGSLLLFEASASIPARDDMLRMPKLVDEVRRLLARPASWHHARYTVAK